MELLGLIAQFTGESRGPGAALGGRLKVGHNLKIAGEYRQRFFREAYFSMRGYGKAKPVASSCPGFQVRRSGIRYSSEGVLLLT